MGFFSGLGRAVGGAARDARLGIANYNYPIVAKELERKGYDMLPTDLVKGNREFEQNAIHNDQGMAAGVLKQRYGFDTNKAGQIEGLALKRAGLKKMNGDKANTGDPVHLQGYPAGVMPHLSTAPGASSTQIKISGPTQTEQIFAGSTAKDPAGSWEYQMAEKDWRNALAAKEVAIVQRDLVPGMDKGEIVRQLNDPDVRDGQNVIDALQNDSDYMMMYNAGPQAFAGNRRPDNLIGEGKFKQVYDNEFPGMVTAYQPQVVEWNGFSESGRTLGPRQSPGGGLHYAPEEMRAERDIMAALSKVGIAPKVGNQVYDYDDGSAYLMQDLRQNYTDMADVYDARVKEANAAAEAGDEKKLGRLQRQERLRNVKQNQQEAMAGVLGYQLYDRPGGIHNVMNHNMMDRPMQVDLGMHDIVEGPARDNVMAMKAVAGLQAAGLSDEAEILDGLMREAVGRGDNAAFHNLAQQGVASLQKIRQIPENIGSYQQLLPQEEMPF